MEKCANNNSMDIYLFNREGKLITVLDTVKNSFEGVDDKTILTLEDALQNIELLTFIASDNKMTDYERVLNKGVKKSRIPIKNLNREKECKLIIYRKITDADTYEDITQLINAPNAKIKYTTTGFLDSSCDEVANTIINLDLGEDAYIEI